MGPCRGDVLGGKYRLVRALGEGGMGAVFEAENLITLRRAAVKWLHPRLAPNELAQQRMLREARATSRIRHRNVVDLYDVIMEDGGVILVMELLTGELLSERLARGGTSLLQLLRWLVPAMEGVAAAHEAEVVHRDIKPENIFLVSQGGLGELVPKVIDFGISKVTENDSARLTRSGVALGTPRYMSFEQLRCDPSLDARTDVYAFGVILYEALLGRVPYEGTSFGEQAVAFVTRDPPLPKALRPELPAALSSLVFRAVSRERQQRQANMLQLVEELRPFCNERAWPAPLMVWEGTPALPEGAVSGACSTQEASPIPIARARRRRTSWPLLMVGTLLGLLALLPLGLSEEAPRRPALLPQPTAARQEEPAPIDAWTETMPVEAQAPTHVEAIEIVARDAGPARARVPRRVAPAEPTPTFEPAVREQLVPPARKASAHRAGSIARDEF